jgi:hypothetical protein
MPVMLTINWITVLGLVLGGAALPAWISIIAKWIRRPWSESTQMLLFVCGISWMAFVLLSVAVLITGEMAWVYGVIGILLLAVAGLAWAVRKEP